MAVPLVMLASMSPRFRNTLSWLHTWMGLILGLAIVMLAVTGAVLVVRPQLDDVINAPLLRVPACAEPLSLDKLAAIAEAAHPASRLYAVEVTKSATSSIAFRFTDYDYVYVNPCSGAVLGIKNHYAGLFGTVDWLHRFKFVAHGDGTGRPIAGWFDTGFLIFLILGGLVLWWPRSRATLGRAFRFNWRARGVTRTLSLHKIVGLYLSLLLLVITVTALPLGFQTFRNALVWLTHSSVATPPPPRLAAPAAGTRLPLGTLYARAEKAVPDLAWVSLYMPAPGSAVMHAEILGRDAPHADAKGHLYLDAYTGRTLRFESYASGTTPGRKLYLYLLALHSGLVGGLPYQLALLIAVLGIPVQAYSGASAYLRRRFVRSKRETRSVRLVRKSIEAAGICSFEFADPQGRPLSPFEAGAHIDLYLPNGLVRQYSLCGDPADRDRYTIAVLRHPNSRGGSQALHDELKPGALVEIGLPRNHFPLVKTARFSLLLAGGIGITPLLAMAEELRRMGAPFELHYSVTARARAAFLGCMIEGGLDEYVYLHVSDEGTRLDMAALLAAHDRDCDIYVCGPESFMDAALAEATQIGWPVERLHREHFSGLARDMADGKPFELQIASTGRLIAVKAGESAATALARHGIDIPTACAEGICGTCITGVRAGEIDHRDMVLTAKERERNDRFTPCCSRASSPLLVLDL